MKRFNPENKKADLKSAFGVPPLLGVNHPLPFIRNPLWPKSLNIEGFPFSASFSWV